MVLALNKISGQIANVSPKILEHPVLGKNLELVEPWFEPQNTKKTTKKSKQEEPVVADIQVISDEEETVEPVISEIEENN